MKGTAFPGDVRLVEGKKIEYRVARILPGQRGQAQHFGHHEQHDETPININGQITRHARASIFGIDGMPFRMRCLLHRAVDLFPNSGHAGGQARVRPLHPIERAE